MIAETQLKHALETALMARLASGQIPSATVLLNDLRALVPAPGHPTTTARPQYTGAHVDLEAYNAVWTALARDLDVLYTELYAHAARAANDVDRVVSWTAGLSAAAEQLAQTLAQYEITDRVLDRVALAFCTNQQLDLSAAVATTSAYIDYARGRATLPVDAGRFTLLPLAGATIRGRALSGTEQPIIGETPTTLLRGADASPWLTQVVAGGGGASYEVLLVLGAPTALTRCEVALTHTQRTTLAYRYADGHWSDETDGPIREGADTNVAAVRIRLTRTTGLSREGAFIYTFGIAQLLLSQQRYLSAATVTSLPLPVDTRGHRVARLELNGAEELPRGTAITYQATFAHANGDSDDPITLTNHTPTYLAHAYPHVVAFCADDPGAIDTLRPPTVRLIAHALTDAEAQPYLADYSLLADHNGVFLGDGQWEISYYEADWTRRPGYTPGPDDWADLSAHGVQDREVQVCYRDLGRGADSLVSGVALTYRFDMVRGPFAGATPWRDRTVYRFRTHVYAAQPFTHAVPGQALRATQPRLLLLHANLDDITTIPANAYDEYGATSNLYATAYLNGRRVIKTRDGMSWSFAAGWNELILYVYCRTPHAHPFALGVSLTPATYLLQDLTAVAAVEPLGVAYPYFDQLDRVTGRPTAFLTATRALRKRLQACSLFDLCWNTPILHRGRYAVEPSTDGTGSTLYVPYDDSARVSAYFDVVPAAADTASFDSVVLSATLTTEDPAVRPSLGPTQLILT